ncbi:MAG: tRNA pseudouridine(38-40) synthase TruA [Candidatus Omnitrophota bacterium]
MRNIKLTIEYDGTIYKGWQSQGKRRTKTIQQVLEKSLEKILGEKIKLIASGRTDSGVHALGQVANFKTRTKLKPDQIKMALNSNLPLDIVVRGAKEVDSKFHSRYDVKSKVYRYVILNRMERPAIYRNRCLFISYRLDLNLMQQEARQLLGRHDFKVFQSANKVQRGSVRTIKSIKINKKADSISIEIESNGFLYKMVRNIVGTLIEIGRGRFEKGTINRLLSSKNRCLAGPSAPAGGLYLLKVNY